MLAQAGSCRCGHQQADGLLKANDIEFHTRWEKANEVALSLQDEAYRRAAIGYDEPVIHQGRLATTADPTTGKERPLTVRMHSNRLLEVLLKFRYGEQMAGRLRVRVEDTGLSADALLAMPATSAPSLWRCSPSTTRRVRTTRNRTMSEKLTVAEARAKAEQIDVILDAINGVAPDAVQAGAVRKVRLNG